MSKVLFSRKPSIDTHSDAFFSQLQTWIDTCMTKHEICRSDGGNLFVALTRSHKKQELLAAILPTRVIDVGDDETSPFLYVSQGTPGKWVALSHCWGKHQPLKLESHSFATFINAIPLESLPPLFRDAILITRRLGFRYLWIDCLCIMQDSRQDWLTESLKMGGIYRNAVFTIAAEAAGDCTAGILSSTARGRTLEGNQQSKDTVEISAHSKAHSVEGTLALTMQSSVKTMRFNQGPLSARKWVLQEEILSTRLLRFAEGLVWWQCRSLQCNERFPCGYTARRESRGSVKRVHIRSNVEWTAIKSFTLTLSRGKTQLSGNNVRRLITLQQIRWYWYDTLNEYCSRRMTYDTDALPAVSGIAKEYQRQLFYDSSSYKAGIWQDDLPSGLLWYIPRQGATIASPYVAPSWSWASIKSGPYYDRDLLDDLISYDTLASRFGPRPKPQAVATVLEIHLTMQQEDPYGQVQNGFMRLQGPCSELCRCTIPPYFFDCYTMAERFVLRYSWIQGMLKTVGKVPGGDMTNLRTVSEFTINRSCIQSTDVQHERCLVIHLVSSKPLTNGQKLAYALVLEQVEGSDDRYRRTGLAMLLEDVKSSQVWPSQIVTIV